MTKLEFDDVIRKIVGLWPRYSFPEELQRTQFHYLRSYGVSDVLEALATHHRENPDARDPLWKQIMPWLREHMVAVEKNDWQRFLNMLRLSAIRNRLPGAQNKTDQDLFMGYLAVNCNQCDLRGKPIPDPDGHRARLHRTFRRNEGAYWSRYLKLIGETVPDWLSPEVDLLIPFPQAAGETKP